MEINIVNFNTTIGVKKPRTIQGMANTSDCPFCDVEHLVGIIETDDNIIL